MFPKAILGLAFSQDAAKTLVGFDFWVKNRKGICPSVEAYEGLRFSHLSCPDDGGERTK